MEVSMTITTEMKLAIERTGKVPVRVEDPDTHTAYILVREDVYHRLFTLAAIDHSDRSFYEVGEFRPKQ
jgi:hypothetical protein